jgi:3' terminal RNA ribose 2'-O-methyltransferase Hen1
MLLTISTTHRPATDLGFLLHKNPAKCQAFELSFGKVHVFYPEAGEDRCTAALLLDVNPVEMVRGRAGSHHEGLLDQYVNDRPYVASSFLSVAISQVFGTALQGRCKQREELATTPIPLVARLAVLPCRGGEQFLRDLFEPLGYTLTATRHPLDATFPDWGESPYYTVELAGTKTLAELLNHLYVLVPVLDNYKHYYIGPAEVDKVLAKGEGWLTSHPSRDAIVRRYLKRVPSLAREALARLIEEETAEAAVQDVGPSEAETVQADREETLERQVSLNDARLGAVLAVLRSAGAKRVLDLGCGEGKLLGELLRDKSFEQIVGLDVSVRSLEIATDRLHMDRMPPRQKERIKLIHGSLVYRDKRLTGFDAAAVVEVIEHLDPARLAAFERVLFEFARPTTIVLTTPNREYNATWDNLVVEPAADSRPAITKLRHRDHRFEWTRSEFRAWAEAIAGRFGYTVRFLPVGPEDPTLGPPTQMAMFNQKVPL